MSEPGFRSAIFERLSGDEEIRDKLSTYGKGPAIFTGARVPGDAQLPYIHVQPVSGVAVDTKTTQRADLLFDVGVFVDDPESSALVEDLAWAIRDALHRRPLAVAAFQNVIAEASPPTIAPTSDEIAGRIVSVRLLFSELQGG